MGDVVSGVTDFIGLTDSDDGSDAARDAASTQAAYQREALDYLKEINALPQQFKEGALTSLAGLYGLEGGTGSQQELIDQAIQSPLYKSIMGGQEAGEEAILRSAAATGGLRSGNVQSNLYDYNTQLQNQALLSAYNNQLQGLQGLAGLTTNENAIAQQTSNIGSTLAQGIVGAAQSSQDASQAGFGNLLGLGQLGLAAYGMFSDRRLKKNIKKLGLFNGLPWYSWDWNSVANKMGLEGSTQGHMADEVFDVRPECVSIKDCFLFVNYKALGVF